MFLGWENNSGKLQMISRKFQNSGKFQNNAINNVKQISLNHAIKNRTISLAGSKWTQKVFYLLKNELGRQFIQQNVQWLDDWNTEMNILCI